MSNNIEKKFAEIKRIGIIKEYHKIIKPDGTERYDIEFYDDLPPKLALFKLDCYLFKKYGLVY